MGFSLDRIKEADSATEIYEILNVTFKFYKNLPNYLKPHYSSKIVDSLYNLIRFSVIKSARPILVILLLI